MLLLFGTYHPPIQSLSAPAAQSTPASARATRVPEELLTESLIEELKTRCCFVGEAIRSEVRVSSSATFEEPGTPSSEFAMSESGYSGISGDEGSADSTFQQTPTSTAFSVIAPSSTDRPPAREGQLQSLADLYTRHSTATDLHIRVEPPPSQQTGTGRGTLLVPGWIRERAAEVLFEGGDVDESSVAEVILDSLLKVCPSFDTLFHPILPPFFLADKLSFIYPSNQSINSIGSGGSPQGLRIGHRHCGRYCYASWLHSTVTRRAHSRDLTESYTRIRHAYR